MKNHLSICLLAACLAALILQVGGCSFGGRDLAPRRYFLVEAARAGKPVAPAAEGVLAVRSFAVAAGFGDKGLVQRTGESTYEPDYYRLFLAETGPSISGQTARWLSDAGLFAAVVDENSEVEPTHTLEGNVLRIYGDFRGKREPKAVLALEFFLLRQRDGGADVAFHKRYDATAPIPKGSADNTVEALNACLSQILTHVESDLRTQFRKR